MGIKDFFLRVLLSLAVVVALQNPGNLSAQSGETNPPPSAQRPDESTPREIIHPYYSLRDGFESTLEMMDRAPRPIEFRLAVHGMSGRTVWAKPMTIQPDEPLAVDIRRMLEALSVDTRGDFSEGSVSIHFKGTGNPLGARMAVKGPNATWNLGPVWREDAYGENQLPERLETLWWELGGPRDAEITANNVSDEPVSADLYLDFQGKRHAAPLLHFAPHEMKHLSITQVLAEMGMTPYKAPIGGLTIVARTQKPVLTAQGTLTDAEKHRMSTLPFPLPQRQWDNALHTTGLPISFPRPDSPFPATGNFTPHIFARNLLDSEQTLTLTIEYPGETASRRVVLPPIVLPGYTTQDIRLDSYYSLLPLPLPFCAIRIQYNGPPGSVMAEVGTIEEKTNEVNLTAVRNEGDGYAGSLASYWSFDDKTDFYLFFTNMGEEACEVGLRVDAGGVHYLLRPILLKPHETTYVSLREIRDKQEPDVNRHTIPAKATEGRLFYNRLDNVPMMGMVLGLSRRK